MIASSPTTDVLNRADFRVWELLASFEVAYPTREWIASRIERSIGTVTRILRRLRDANIIEITRTGGASIYTVLIPPPEVKAAGRGVVRTSAVRTFSRPRRALDDSPARHRRTIAHRSTDLQDDRENSAAARSDENATPDPVGGMTPDAAADSLVDEIMQERPALSAAEPVLRRQARSCPDALRWAVAELARRRGITNPVGWLVTAIENRWDLESVTAKNAARERRRERDERQAERDRRARAERDAEIQRAEAHRAERARQSAEVREVLASMDEAAIGRVMEKITNDAYSQNRWTGNMISAQIAEKKLDSTLLLPMLHAALIRPVDRLSHPKTDTEPCSMTRSNQRPQRQATPPIT